MLAANLCPSGNERAHEIAWVHRAAIGRQTSLVDDILKCQPQEPSAPGTFVYREFLPAFLAFTQRAFAASEILCFAAADNLRLRRFGFAAPGGKPVADPASVVFGPGRLPRLTLPLECPSRAAIAPEMRSRSCFNCSKISLVFMRVNSIKTWANRQVNSREKSHQACCG